ncbi:MAG: phospholipid-binding protein PBP [Planctomycetota bacterium]|nr:MAG: phospholipid-binding protein PBP [Planctomycetota bacterium]
MAFALLSPAFKSGHEIPAKHTSEDKGLPPLLDFRGAPPETVSLVLTVTDQSAAKGAPVAHWIVYDIPATAGGIGPSGLPPPGSSEGMNDFGKSCYTGPMPTDTEHRYQFKLYALDIALKGLRQPPLAQVEAAMKGHVLAHALLIGTYTKKRKLL